MNRIKQVTSSMPAKKRFGAYASNYQALHERVLAGEANWGDSREDPYQVGDWAMLLTPIELSAWGAIRSLFLPLWPQLPVGKYFVDFGCPLKRVAVECDGAKWHDAKKDAKRDAALAEMGWITYRAPGWLCEADDGKAIYKFMQGIAHHWA